MLRLGWLLLMFLLGGVVGGEAACGCVLLGEMVAVCRSAGSTSLTADSQRS